MNGEELYKAFCDCYKAVNGVRKDDDYDWEDLQRADKRAWNELAHKIEEGKS